MHNNGKKYKQFATGLQQPLLDSYIVDFRQSIVLLQDNIDNNVLLKNYRLELAMKERVAYIDFRKIRNAKDLAEHLLEQYKQFFNNATDFKLSQDDHYAVADVLDLFTKVDNKHENIVVWMDNFTNILSLQEHGWLFGLLRGTFQHHQNIAYVFTSDSKEKVNKIFMNHDNPFLKFARIIQ